MKKLTSTLAVVILGIITAYSQVPQSFKYQAVVRDISGNVLPNRSVSFKISILQTSPIGAEVYVELHSATTNDFGLVNLEIGNGTFVSGNF